uniref:Uncharacterized protein n=1 Tax=Panagrolaimus superbus TaxID=310955 RepID=A0A914Y8C8_9BILA
MKLVYFFSIFAFLLIQLQISVAVECPIDLTQKPIKVKECDACAVVTCDPLVQFGCLNDSDKLFKNCANYASDIDYIKNNPVEIYQNGTFRYFSGCGAASNGIKCMTDLDETLTKDIDDKKAKHEYEEPYIVKSDTTATTPSQNGATPSSSSDSQNGAFKILGFLGIGWILGFIENLTTDN